MALHHAESGEVIDLSHAPETVPNDQSVALYRTDDIEVIRRTLHAGQQVPEHEVRGDLTLQCLSGKARVVMRDKTADLTEATLVCVAACEPYAIEAIDDAVVLMTVVRTRE